MQRIFLTILLALISSISFSQLPKTHSSADIYHELQKLQVFGKVLYIAAHPDDENTRLLAYLVNERKYETAYMSITRGDGGQNLIGDEQGMNLGLIRTQELLAARRIDGAQQFFSRAVDFGYSKSPEETLKTWDHEKVLSDVVWVIRTFKPDIIITRFPTTGEGGHGHHTASAILAGEAFDAAGDATKFPEQLKTGVTVWQPKRLLWNTFNFGSRNTTSEDQLKLDVGGYNAVLGQGYGELASESRSQHKSQGFGVAARRGESTEYFKTIKGEKPTSDIMDGVKLSVDKFDFLDNDIRTKYSLAINNIIHNYKIADPAASLPALLDIREFLWKEKGTKELQARIDEIAAECAGIYAEAIASKQVNVIGDSTKIEVTVYNQGKASLPVEKVQLGGPDLHFGEDNVVSKTITTYNWIGSYTQPYWLKQQPENGIYKVDEQNEIGKPQNDPMLTVPVTIHYGNMRFIRLLIPVQYKYTDPVKAERYEPIAITYPGFVSSKPSLVLMPTDKTTQKTTLLQFEANTDIDGALQWYKQINGKRELILDSIVHLKKGEVITKRITLSSSEFVAGGKNIVGSAVRIPGYKDDLTYNLHKISYDHIPDIFLHTYDYTDVLKIDLKTVGKTAGYIVGAGDKVPAALTQMGYMVTMLQENDMMKENLKKFDVIITGVRAYNIHEWLNNSYDALMAYVADGGVLVTQYNTSNSFGPVKAKISPYPFTISRNRVTDEKAAVSFINPKSELLTYPNLITHNDFDDWIQERSIYEAVQADSRYEKVLSMHDDGEAAQDGSLLMTKYGKGKYVYASLVFFRELPAAVPGAYRLFANIIAKPKN